MCCEAGLAFERFPLTVGGLLLGMIVLNFLGAWLGNLRKGYEFTAKVVDA